MLLRKSRLRTKQTVPSASNSDKHTPVMQRQLSNPVGKRGQGMEMSTYNDLINPMAKEKKYQGREQLKRMVFSDNNTYPQERKLEVKH